MSMRLPGRSDVEQQATQALDYGLSGESIICFAGEDWWYHHPHSKNHILKRLAGRNRVLFVNSISMGLPSMSNPDFFLKIRRKLKSYMRWLRRVPEGLWVMTPVVIPLYGSRFAKLINSVLLNVQMRLAMMICGMDRPIIWVAIPSAADIAESLDSKLLLYQVSDKYDATEDSALSRTTIREFDRRLKAKAAIVLYSGRKLFDEADEPNRFLLSQGVDYEHFSQEAASTAEDIAEIPHPVLGYFGAMDYVMDSELMQEVLRRRPEWHWAMIGLKSNLIKLNAPNLHFLGSKPYSQLPSYVKHFDVCILPWRTDNPFTQYGSAIKVREYLATGKPIVMTQLYEYRDAKGVRFFANADEFIAAVENALTQDSPHLREMRQSSVRHGTWDDRTRQVASIIHSLLTYGHMPRSKAVAAD